MIFVDGGIGQGLIHWFEELFGNDSGSAPADDNSSAKHNYDYDYTNIGETEKSVLEQIIQNKLDKFPSNTLTSNPFYDEFDYTDYSIADFYKGLLASQGAENEVNRKYNADQAAINRSFQAREAAIQREWYEQMSNSAYQRSVADMKAAGINPILAYSQGGAATATTGLPTGSAASYGVTGGDTISSLLNGVANLISSVSSASNSKLNKVFKIIKGVS